MFHNNFGTNFSVSQSGDFLFRYAITSSAGDVSDVEAVRFGMAASTPLEAIFTKHPRRRQLPPSGGAVELDNQAVVLLTLKRAEDDRGLILRLWNISARAQAAGVCFKGRPAMKIAQVRKTSITEDDTAEAIGSAADAFTVRLEAHEMVTVRVIGQA
jgi:alpha-mannosidase